MCAPFARPVALSHDAQTSCVYSPIPRNLPLTIRAKASDK